VPSFAARVELDFRDFDTDHVDTLMDLFDVYEGAVARSLAGRVELLLTVPAANLRQASTTVLAVAQAAGDTAVVLELLSTDEFYGRTLATPVPDLLSVTDAAESLGVSGQRVRQLLEDGKLAGVKIGATWSVLRTAVEQRSDTAVRQTEPAEVTAYVGSQAGINIPGRRR
jgi:excisionase family DNA binding protein